MTNANSGHLFDNLLLFGRLLRGLGIDVDTGRMIDLASALELVEIGSQTDFYFTLRGLLVHRREDITLFDRAFAAFWRKPAEDGWGIAVSADGEVRRQPGCQSNSDSRRLIASISSASSPAKFLRRSISRSL